MAFKLPMATLCSIFLNLGSKFTLLVVILSCVNVAHGGGVDKGADPVSRGSGKKSLCSESECLLDGICVPKSVCLSMRKCVARGRFDCSRQTQDTHLRDARSAGARTHELVLRCHYVQSSDVLLNCSTHGASSSGERDHKMCNQLKRKQTAGLVKQTADIGKMLPLFEKERARLDDDLNPATEYHCVNEVVASLRSYAKQIDILALSVAPRLAEISNKLKKIRKDAIAEVLTEMLNQMSDLKTKRGLIGLVNTWAKTEAGQRSRQLVYEHTLSSYSSQLSSIATKINETKTVDGKPLRKLAKMARLGRAFAAKKSFVNALKKLQEDSCFRKEYEMARKKGNRNNKKHHFKSTEKLQSTELLMSLHNLIHLVQKELKH